MSLIAGYYNARGTPDHASFRGKLNRFTILPSDRLEDYETALIESASGGLMVIQRPNSPCSIVRRSIREDDLLLLGFNEAVSSARRIEESNAREKIEQVKSNDGEYLCAVLEREKDVLHIVNDRFSSRPLYLVEHKGRLVFSTNITFLLTLFESPTLDPLGWLQMASYSHTIGSRTTFQKVCRLDPATHLLCDREGVKKTRYWQLQHEVVKDPDVDEIADAAFYAFREGGAMRARNRQGMVALSGGLDSRLVAAVVPPEDFLAFTFANSTESEETPEVNVASQVAERLGLEHHVASMPKSHVSEVVEQIVRLTGGLTPVQHPAATMHFIERMKRGHGFMMGGGIGGTLPGSFVPSAKYADAALTEELVRRFAVGRKKFTRAELQQIFRRDIIEAWYSDLDRSMLESFEDIEGPTAAHRVTAWAMRVRQPAFTFASPIHTHSDVTEANPHLDYSYVNHLLHLPAEWLVNKRFYKYMIWRGLPQLRDVRYANTGEKLSGQSQFSDSDSTPSLMVNYGKKALALPVRYLRMVKRRLVGHQPSFHDEFFQEDRALTESVHRILRTHDELSEVFDIPRARAFMNRYQEGKRNRYTELYGTLVTACYVCKCHQVV